MKLFISILVTWQSEASRGLPSSIPSTAGTARAINRSSILRMGYSPWCGRYSTSSCRLLCILSGKCRIHQKEILRCMFFFSNWGLIFSGALFSFYPIELHKESYYLRKLIFIILFLLYSRFYHFIILALPYI